MDAIKYFNIKKRMTNGCKSASTCNNCPMSVQYNDIGQSCVDFEMLCPEKAVEIVENWGKEHPVKTRMSDFLEKFPRAMVLKYANGEYIDICPVNIDDAISCPNGSCKTCKFEYWNEEVEDTDERD